MVAIVYAIMGLLTNTFSGLSVKELPPEELDETGDQNLQAVEEKYTLLDAGRLLGGSLGTAICGWLLAAVGYVENAAVQTAGTINMLHLMYLWLPMVFNIVVTIILSKLKVEKASADLLAENV